MIEFTDVEKSYGKFMAVKKTNLVIPTGQFTCVIGTSGSGKTTLLRMINKMVKPSAGSISINGTDIESMEGYELRRKIGYVIQNVGLFPNMTIRENILIIPKLLKWDESEVEGLAESLMEKVDLDLSLLDRHPDSLSGGQKQRVGVLRALAANQELILLDEPFGALDPITRQGLQKLIKKIQKELAKTIVFVTHDIDEAIELSDKIIIMDQGEIVQYDTPGAIIEKPKNDFVRNLLGKNSIQENITSTLTVSDLMINGAASINENESVYDAIKEMSLHSVDTLLVVDEENRLIGYIDGFDIEEPADKNIKINQVMRHDTKFVYEDDSIVSVIRPLLNGSLKYRPVVDKENHLVGIVRRSDVVSLIYKELR